MKAHAVLAFGMVAVSSAAARADATAAAAPLARWSLDDYHAKPARIGPDEHAPGVWVSAPRRFVGPPIAEAHHASQPELDPMLSLPAHGERPPERAARLGPVRATVVVVAPFQVETYFDAPKRRIGAGTAVLWAAPTPVCLQATANPPAWESDHHAALVLGDRASLEVSGADVGHASGSDVWLVREERLIERANGTAALHVLDAWVDAKTGGSRLVQEAATPLSLVARFHDGLIVYAAYEASKVHFIVRGPGWGQRSAAFPTTIPLLPHLEVPGTGSPCGFARYDVKSREGGAFEVASFEGLANIVEPHADRSTLRPFLVFMSAARAQRAEEPAVAARLVWPDALKGP